MARVIKGRSPYSQGTSKYEAFRPEQRQYVDRKERSSMDELLRIMALAEKIGKSPLGGLAITGIQKLTQKMEGGAAPTMEQAIAARAGAKAIPTPEEQGKAAGEAQADKFLKEAVQQPAPAIAKLSPARMSVRRAPPPAPPVDEVLLAEQKAEQERTQARNELKRRSAELTSQLSSKRELLERMEAIPAKFKTRMRMLMQQGPEGVSAYLEAVRDKQARTPAGVSTEAEDFYDIMADYLRLMKGVAVPDIDADVGRQAREATVPQGEVNKAKEEIRRLRAQANGDESEMTENLDKMSDADIVKRTKEIETARQKARDLELDLTRRTSPSEMDALAQMDENALQRDERRGAAVERIMGTEEPVGTTTIPDRRAEGERARQRAMGALEPTEGEPTQPAEMQDPARRFGVPLERTEISEIVDKAYAPEAPAEPAKEFMDRARAGEKSLQTQREEAVQTALNTVVGPSTAARMPTEQANTFTELVAQAREAATPQAQADLLRKADSVQLPAMSIFDAMFGGPQKRARTELLKFFPKALRPLRQRSASQTVADEALAEQRRAQTARIRGLTKFYDPARVKKSNAQTKKVLEVADAQEQGYSATEALIKQRLAAAARKPSRGRGRRPRNPAPDIRRVATNERNEAKNNYNSEITPLKNETNRLEAERSRLKTQKVGNVPDPGATPAAPGRGALRREREAYAKRLQEYNKKQDKHTQDQTALTQRNNRLKKVNKDLKEVNSKITGASQRRDKRIKLVNDEEARLLGGSTAQMRRGAAKRRKVQQPKPVKKPVIKQPPTDADANRLTGKK